jgi:hypothetical protein
VFKETKRNKLIVSWQMQLYGFPAASVLIETLRSETRSGIPVDYTTPRAEIIRNLCVFISHLDSVELPRNGSDALFKRASKYFRTVIDEAIESRLESKDSSLHASNIDDWAPSWNQDGLAMDFLGDGVQLESMDFGIMFDQWLI